MFDFTIFQDLKAEGLKKEIIESIQENIAEKEERMHDQAAYLGVYLSPTTMNR
ncbi:MAG: hypothetical protein IKP29_01050 [Pseudobutyrivibrio sp.]|nr:hypothetical protein [Pseudobutyrivibrio sp.]